jgi:hypothetical protein
MSSPHDVAGEEPLAISAWLLLRCTPRTIPQTRIREQPRGAEGDDWLRIGTACGYLSCKYIAKLPSCCVRLKTLVESRRAARQNF